MAGVQTLGERLIDQLSARAPTPAVRGRPCSAARRVSRG